MKKPNMKRTLFKLLMLTAILLVGCDRKGSSSLDEGGSSLDEGGSSLDEGSSSLDEGSSSLAKPPIAIDDIAPAVANQMAGKLAERFVRVGEVRFHKSANVYHVEVFYRLDEQEIREVLEFSRLVHPYHPNLLVYGAKCNTNTEFIGKDTIRSEQGFYITIDEMMSAKDTSQQDGGGQPATRPESKLQDPFTHNP